MQIQAKEYAAQQEIKKKERSRLFRCKTLSDLQKAILDSKQSERTPLIISTEEGQVKSRDLVDAL